MSEFEIHSVEELEKLSFDVTWQYFEKLVEFIFEQNGFDTIQNKVIVANNDRRQFDVIAKKNNITYLIECKRWKSRANSVSELKRAVEIHIERCAFYAGQFPEEQVQPLLVTPLQGMPEEHENVYITPLISLNWFLNSQ